MIKYYDFLKYKLTEFKFHLLKSYLLIFLFFCYHSVSIAQSISGIVTDIMGKPLQEANILWEKTSNGTFTDKDGFFSISKSETDSVLIISYVGFLSEKVKVNDVSYWEVQLIEDANLLNISVISKGQSTKFLNDVAKVEVLGVREIQRAACCSLAGCFSTNSNVESNVTNVVTDAKELRILGLSGVYNQVLIDGMPLIQGLSYPYGPGSYPGTMIEKIFITKGANSVLQGFESISGQINIEFIDVDKAPKLFLNAFANSFGETQYNVNYTAKKKSWSNLTSAHLTLPAKERDVDKDGFRDIVRTNRFSVFNRWSYDNPEKPNWRVSLGGRYLYENREGGQVGFDKDKDLGNSEIYGQNVLINHGEFYFKTNYILNNNTSIIFLNSSFAQKQESYFGIKKYVGNQFNNTSNVYFDYYYGAQKNNLKIGFSHRHNKLKEEISFLKPILELDYDGKYNTNYNVPGFFAENKWNLDKFTIISGIRADHQGSFGWKIAPRILVRAQVNERTDIRFNLGKGYRRSHFFTENPNLLSSNRQLNINPSLSPEEAVNIGLNMVETLYWRDMIITLSGDAYHTYFQNQIFPDYNISINTAVVDNNFGESISKSYQFENKWGFTPQFDVKFAYNYLDVYQKKEGIKVPLPFVPRHKWIANTSYSTNNDQWQFDLTYHWTGRKKLPSTEKYPLEFQRADSSEPYNLLDFQITKRWTDFQIYSGVENIFDFRQTFPILSSDQPFGAFFDPSFNWGPTKGREFYLGIRYSLKVKDKI